MTPTSRPSAAWKARYVGPSALDSRELAQLVAPDRRPGRVRGRRRRHVQARVVAEDLRLELLDVRRGIEPELLAQP